RCYGAEPARSEIASQSPCGWPLSRYSTANPHWGSSIAVCARSWERRRPLHPAHKLARIVYHLLTTHEPYDDSVFTKAEEKYQQRTEKRLMAQALSLGFTLVPTPNRATSD